MPINQPMWHSFDDGRTWLPGRPTLATEKFHPGPIRYVLATSQPEPRR